MADEPRNYKMNAITGKYMAPITLANALQTSGISTASVTPLAGAYTVFALQQKRGTTSASLESTKVSYRVQGSVDNTNWFTLGAATRAVSSTAWALSPLTSTAPVSYVRLTINLFTTSAGAATSSGAPLSSQNRIPLTVKLLPHN